MVPLLSLNPCSLIPFVLIDIVPGGWSPVIFTYIVPQLGQDGLHSKHSLQNMCPHFGSCFGSVGSSMQMEQFAFTMGISGKGDF